MDFFRTTFVVLVLLVAEVSLAKTTSTNSSIELDSGSTVAFNAYYSEQNPARRSLGLTLTSDLPVASGSASIDYVMSQPGPELPGPELKDSLQDSELLQVRLNSTLSSLGRDIGYGLRYFSAGEQFQPTELRGELQRYLISAGAEGTEMWASVRLADIEIKPQVRQVDSNEVRTETWLVNARSALTETTSINYLFQDSADARDGNLAQTTKNHIGIRHQNWSLSWQQSEQLTRQASTTLLEDRLQTVAGTLSVLEETRARPDISLELQMRRYRQEGQQLTRRDTSVLAGFNVAKKVFWLGEQSPPAHVQAAFTYRYHDQDNGLLQNDEFGFRITFQQTI